MSSKEFTSTAPENSVEMDRILFESIGLDMGFEVDIEPYYDEMISVDSGEFGIMADPAAGPRDEDALITVKTNELELLDFMGDRVFMKSSKFNWKEHGLIISIKKTNPKLQPGDVARFGELKSFSFGWADEHVFDEGFVAQTPAHQSIVNSTNSKGFPGGHIDHMTDPGFQDWSAEKFGLND